jgi:hypothetical protein
MKEPMTHQNVFFAIQADSAMSQRFRQASGMSPEDACRVYAQGDKSRMSWLDAEVARIKRDNPELYHRLVV